MPIPANIRTHAGAPAKARLLVIALLIHAMLGAVSAAEGQPAAGGPRGLAEAEVARRTQLVKDATASIQEGDLLRQEGDGAGAMAAYAKSVSILPVAPATISLRDAAAQRFAETSTATARTLASNGQYDEATRLLQSAIAEEMAPGYAPARQLLAEIADPQIFNPTLTPEHLRDVEEVRGLLLLASELVDTAQFDAAEDTYERVLSIDRYNSSARQGLQRIEQLQKEYLNDARINTRAKMLTEVDKVWDTSVPSDFNLGELFGAPAGPAKQGASISTKLATIMLPQVQFEDASLTEVIEFLSIRSRQLDTSTTDPALRGVNILIQGGQEYANQQVSLNLSNVPLGEVLRYAAEQADMRYDVEGFAVRVVPLTMNTGGLVSKVFRVPPDFIQSGPQDGGDGNIDPFAPQATSGTTGQLLKRLTAREFLERQGITFPEGAAADFNPTSSSLIVRNTQDNINLIETMVDQARSSQPKQVEIRVTMVEIRDTTLNEIGYDWLLSPFNVAGSDRLFATGGVRGNTPIDNAAQSYSFLNPLTGSPIGTSPITAGLRGTSGLRQTLTVESLLGTASRDRDRLINNANSPGIFSLSGVFTDPQFQTVVRALEQGKGVDFVTAPSTVTRSGQRAKIEVIREIIYPTEYDAPQIPQSVGFLDTIIDNGDGDDLGLGGAGEAPVIPATPTAFETRSTGVTLEVEPVIGDDNFTIDVSVAPEFVEFLGFIDYGTDIQRSSVASGEITTAVAENSILQPVFRTNRANTSLTIYDRQTIVMAAVLSSEAKQISDKVPLLGSLPGVGHLFRSNVSEVTRRNVIFFVSVKLIDPGGQPLNAPLATGR